VLYSYFITTYAYIHNVLFYFKLNLEFFGVLRRKWLLFKVLKVMATKYRDRIGRGREKPMMWLKGEVHLPHGSTVKV
jgi:hypothetical protein